jgi:hypothetical protein
MANAKAGEQGNSATALIFGQAHRFFVNEIQAKKSRARCAAGARV